MTCYVCVEQGEEAYDSFKHEELEEASRKKQFHDPMRKTRLKTFTTIERKKHSVEMLPS